MKKTCILLVLLLASLAALTLYLYRLNQEITLEIARADALAGVETGLTDLVDRTQTFLREEARENALLAVRALNLHRQTHGTYPDTLETLFGEQPPELLDAWQTPLRYTTTGDSFTLHAAGPDRRFDTADDLFFTFPDEEKK